MKTRTKIAILTTAALLGVAAFAVGPKMQARLAEKLGLSTQQQQQMTQLRQQHQKETLALRHQIEERQLALRQEMEKEKPSEATVFKGIDELSSLKAQMQKARFRQRQAMEAVLTPEQRQQFRSLREERKERRGHGAKGQGRHQMGMAGGQGPGCGQRGEMDDDFPPNDDWAGEAQQ